MIYILIILSTSVLSYFLGKEFSRKDNAKKHSFIKLILCALIVLTPSIFAGIRSPEVGTDTSFYALDDYQKSVNSDNFLEVARTSNDEPGFVLLAFLSAKIFGSFNVFLFLIELIMMIFILMFAIDRRDSAPIHIAILLYLLLCFGESLSIMRQNIALSILLFSLKYIDKRKFLHLVCFWALAYSFHQSAIFFIIFYSFYFIIKAEKITLRKKYFLLLTTSAILVLIVSLIEPIVGGLVEVGFLTERILVYFSSEVYSGLSLGWFGFIYRMGLVLIFVLLFMINKKNPQERFSAASGLCLLLFSLILYFVSMRYVTIIRLSSFIIVPVVLTNSALLGNFKNLKNRRSQTHRHELVAASVVLLLLASFLHDIIFQDYNRTYPYKTIFGTEISSINNNSILALENGEYYYE